MMIKKEAQEKVARYLSVPERERLDLGYFLKVAKIDIETFEQCRALFEAGESEDTISGTLEKNANVVDQWLLDACKAGNATALKTYYQLTNRLIDRIKVELSADDIAERNLRAERELRELKERRKLPEAPSEVIGGRLTSNDT